MRADKAYKYKQAWLDLNGTTTTFINEHIRYWERCKQGPNCPACKAAGKYEVRKRECQRCPLIKFSASSGA